jgi:hypothetical protein
MYYKLLRQSLPKVLVELCDNERYFMYVRTHPITIISHIYEITNLSVGIGFGGPSQLNLKVA